MHLIPLQDDLHQPYAIVGKKGYVKEGNVCLKENVCFAEQR